MNKPIPTLKPVVVQKLDSMHNAGHLIYWVTATVTAHSLWYGMLCGSLAALGAVLLFCKREHPHA